VFLKVASKDVDSWATDFASVASPKILPPITVAAGLRDQQVEQRVAVAGVAAGETRFDDFAIEHSAHRLHGAEDVFEVDVAVRKEHRLPGPSLYGRVDRALTAGDGRQAVDLLRVPMLFCLYCYR